MERVTRIELVTKAWEAAVIPFHHTRREVLNRLPVPDLQVEEDHGDQEFQRRTHGCFWDAVPACGPSSGWW